MSLSTIDPTSALVVIDLQNGIAGRPAAHDTREVVARAAELADAFRERGLPVVLVTAAGRAPGRTEAGRSAAVASPAPAALPEGFMDLVPELEGGGIRIVKRTWGAFHGTDLHEQLQAAGTTQIVLAGIATSKGVESTARAAYEHGYHVTLATDAMTDSTLAAHVNSVELAFPELGETGTSAEVIALLPAASATTAAPHAADEA